MAADICRLCLKPAGPLLSIYGTYEDKYNLMDIMYELTLMEVRIKIDKFSLQISITVTIICGCRFWKMINYQIKYVIIVLKSWLIFMNFVKCCWTPT